MEHIRLLLLLLLFAPCNLFAIETPLEAEEVADSASIQQSPITFYIEIESVQNGAPRTQSTVRLEIGRVLSSMMELSKEESKRIYDRRFTSLIDAANLLSLKGWHLVATETSEQRTSVTTRWIMSKTVLDPKDLIKDLLDSK